MCGRAKLDTDVSEIKIQFWIPLGRPTPNIPARYNLAPTQDSPIVRFDAEAGERSLDVMRWGLVPFWAKDIKIGYSTFNARAETIDTASVFREAFKRRRCLVPLDSFYEWKKLGPKLKQPYAIGRAGKKLLSMAGLWETWKSPAGETVRSFTIITTTPNAMMAELHNRMPAILTPDEWPTWLGEEPADRDELKAMLRPYPADDLVMWPTDPRVGNVQNDDPSLIEPVGLARQVGNRT
jgi:putative SOS response-associated peptidase YedK